MAGRQVPQADGSVVHYDQVGHAIRQVAKDGEITTFQYRTGEQYVATTGDQHVLFGPDGVQIKQWTGNDESLAAHYRRLTDGDYSLTDPSGAVTEYTADGEPIRQFAEGQITTFEQRAGGQYVATTGDQHVLYGADGVQIKQWTGNDESSAVTYDQLDDGGFSLTDPSGAVTEYTADGAPVRPTVDGQVTTTQQPTDSQPAGQQRLPGGGYSQTDANGSTTEYDADGELVRQVVDGQVTTFEQRAGGQYVATTGDQHVLYGADGVEIKQWTGGDESQAADYQALNNGHYSLTDKQGTTEYAKDGHLVSQTAPDGTVTTFQYRGDNYVATTGDQHVLYGADGVQQKQWTGDDESQASVYRQSPDGGYKLTSPDGDVTQYASDGHLIRQVVDGQVTTFQYRGEDYVATTGDQHVLYSAAGEQVKQWAGSDESQAAVYHKEAGGNYSLTNPDGDLTEFTSDGHLVRQVADGQTTTFQYRNEDYVATTGDQHVLYDAAGDQVKQWTGADESQAAVYRKEAGGNYSLTNPDGDVTEFTSDGHLVRQVADGQTTTFQYRGEDYVATTGDQHVLYGSDGVQIKQWTGEDESQAAQYHALGNGHYSLTDKQGTSTEYAKDGRLVSQTAADGQVTTFDYRGEDYVATTGDQHVLYDAAGDQVKQWTGNDESQAAVYHKEAGGNYSLTNPDGDLTEYTSDGHLVRQVADGQTTTFQYRGEDYVATTGDQHVLYGSDGVQIKQWTGEDESQAAQYHALGNGHYSLTDKQGTSTEYAKDGRLVSQTAADGQVTTFDYRGEDYVATTGDQHVLYNAAGEQVKQWAGDDESQAAFYHKEAGGNYSLTKPDGDVTEFTSDGHLVRQVDDGKLTTFDYRGEDYVATTGDQHVLYNAAGDQVKQWAGADESQAAFYREEAGGNYSLTKPDGDVTDYTSDGHLVQQVDDGKLTTFDYRGEDYVATTGDQHVLYGSDGVEIKQWTGNDESQAAQYRALNDGHYSLTNKQGTTEYAKDGHLVSQTAPDGKVTTFDYRGEDYVATTGDQHVLYNAAGDQVKQWTGGDESQAALYHEEADGNYSLTKPDGDVTVYTSDGHLVQQVDDGKLTTFDYRGEDYVATTGDQHVLYNAAGDQIKQWTGNDESQAAHYRPLGNGHYTLTGKNGTTEYTQDGHLVSQTAANGALTTFQYRGEDYVATTGDQHVLYNAAGEQIKQWKGPDEGNAQLYRDNHDGTYTLENPRAHTQATYELDDGDPVWQRNADGSTTTFEQTPQGLVGTTGNSKVLYDAGGNEVKQWRTADSSDVFYTSDAIDKSTPQQLVYKSVDPRDAEEPLGERIHYKSVDPRDAEEPLGERVHYTSTGPGETETRTYQRGALRPESQVNDDGSVTYFQYRANGQYVATTGDEHVLYDENNKQLKQWKGDDESTALLYRDNQNGTYTLSSQSDVTSTTYQMGSNNYVSQVNKDKSVTNFTYRGNGEYVATTGDQHVLYDKNHDEIKQWKGDDESTALLYRDNQNGTYTLSSQSDFTSTTYQMGSNNYVSQVNKDKSVTNFTYRGNGEYVATTGNQHVLYDKDHNEIKQWTGEDETKASFYRENGDGTYALTDPDGTVTTYQMGSNNYVKQVKADGTLTTFQYRANGEYVGTTGNLHVLYDANGNEIKEWKGDDETKAQLYHKNSDGTYTLTDPDGTVTTYNTQGKAVLIHKPGEQDQIITWNPDGSYTVAQGPMHYRYDANGMLLESWEGEDSSKSHKYKYNDDGTLTITGPDGTNTYGANGMPISGTFLTNLKALSDAMTSIRKERDAVETDLVQVKNTFTGISEYWNSPAGRSFQELSGDFMNASLDLVSTLDEGLRRMHVAYNNYVASEQQNAASIAAIDAAGQKLKNGVA